MSTTMERETSIPVAATRFGGGKAVRIELTTPQRIRQALSLAARLGFTETEIESLNAGRFSLEIYVALSALRRVFTGHEAEVVQHTADYRHYKIRFDGIEFDATERIESPAPGKAVL